jgi:hypothetical protein
MNTGHSVSNRSYVGPQDPIGYPIDGIHGSLRKEENPDGIGVFAVARPGLEPGTPRFSGIQTTASNSAKSLRRSWFRGHWPLRPISAVCGLLRLDRVPRAPRVPNGLGPAVMFSRRAGREARVAEAHSTDTGLLPALEGGLTGNDRDCVMRGHVGERRGARGRAVSLRSRAPRAPAAPRAAVESPRRRRVGR